MSIDYAIDIVARLISYLLLQRDEVAACGGWQEEKKTSETSA